MQETDPPPYREHNGTAEEADDGNSHSDKIFVPPRTMKKVMALETHQERIRMVEEYITKKGEAVEAKEKALSRQKRALAETIKDAKKDVRSLRGTYWQRVRNILDAKEPLIRSLLFSKSYGLDLLACNALFAARKNGARLLHKKETEKIEAEFQKASKRVDEEYNALLDAMLASNKQTARAEVEV
ncbi:uncharacterized protein Triagg1_8660 [Trichoderma aggressivum f. europaeum]|uniref:Uncharacterized protein n=1 Tax=Trichoderma aggressivum f. europaeum TaxID=173218 RepID=A0AAE1IA77_9HYPO|nr:hypothetical protein Triagg1_8660 [Trichoderma aggressivum f. europaeum]